LNRVKRFVLSVPWDKVSDVALRVVIWLLLGSAINLIPILTAYLTKAGEQSGGGNYSLSSALSSGDLLLAATVMLPPTLADLALNVRKAKRTRALVVVLGALLSLFSLLFYGYAFANNLARESNSATVAINLGPQSVANWSVGFFLSAVLLGAICAGFLANETAAAPTPNGEQTVPPNLSRELTAIPPSKKETTGDA
jgi:hypothetical protein